MYHYVPLRPFDGPVGMKMGAPKDKGALAGLSAEERRIMHRLLQTPPKTHKAAPKPITTQAEAQRRRRDTERLGRLRAAEVVKPSLRGG